MIPINYDLLIGLLCTAAGILMLFRMGAFTKKKYTPAITSITVFVGLVAWSIVTLVSVSAVTTHPWWLYNEGWFGSWGYTSARFFMALSWILTLIVIDAHAPKCKQEVKVKL